MGGLLFLAVQTQTLTEIIDSDCLAADDACACLGHLASRIIGVLEAACLGRPLF